MDKSRITSSRKREHLEICCDRQVEAGFSGFDDIRLVHNALPECDMSKIDTGVHFLGNKLKSPLFIAAMTGGHPDTAEVNMRLARAAQHFNIGMGVGSQRAALENPELEDSFTIVRENAPDAFLCGNLGAVQLVEKGIEWAERAVEMIDAQALCIHLNPLQEAIQPEGDHDSSGCLNAICELCSSFKHPVIVKETGCGISYETAAKLWGAGVSAIDIGGLGGTSWAAVEAVRADRDDLAETGRIFSDWGIPTAVSLVESSRFKGPVIATGGMRSGIDIAKSITLGATLGGMALPLLKPAMTGEEALFKRIELINRELVVSMYLTGAKSCQELAQVRTYITGITGDMLKNNKIPELK
ncbi:type 2 isopentenyl-diphosphate Delta-isomerase [Methanochimaera problematica]|uniref:type 2 isopentenyl-diphosphate Delta-isomerase n=1 Tax=Methanochimaera problematica TaxID=2609417 RepID=UPI002938EE28|nr:type 2 isopentenyl-diphosphate Delta-isomerase [Methanoplanus sp. FWC-SCC4]